MPRNSFKCPECGGNYKFCKKQDSLTKQASTGLPATERKDVYICNGQQMRHPHPPILIEAHKIFVKEKDKEEVKDRLHTLKLNIVYPDVVFVEAEKWHEWAKKTFKSG